MESHLRNFRRKSKGLFKTPFFYLVVVLIIFLFGISVFGSRAGLKSLSLRGFSFLTATAGDKLPSQDLFAQSPRNFIRESPEMTFVQRNSLVGVSSPVMITPQVLGTIVGDLGVETRKEIVEYTVKPGDTLSAIAGKFGISQNTIFWANDLSSSSMIKLGQKLIILPVSGVIYHVKKDDTLSGIAKTYKGDIEEIVAFNELSSEGDIFIGDILVIPDGKMPARVARIALTPLAESYFIFPCEGKITQGLHPFNAIDIANRCGKPVVAAASGEVQRAGSTWLGGNRVTILHPNTGVVTYYGHLSKILVSPGQPVNTGDIIGYIGNTGYTLGVTGCHLHFGVRGARNFLSQYPVGTTLSWKK